VLSLARIDKPALMRRLMQLGCIYSGQILSYQKMIGQLQDVGNTTTLAHYLQLLSAAWIVTGLNKHAGDQARTRGSSPKLQVFDSALQASLLGEDIRTLRTNAELWGRLTESAVGAHLLNTLNPTMQIAYWRDRNKEVDFVLHTPSALLAIEVKSGRQTRAAPGLAEFKRQYPEARTLQIGTGGIPLEEILATPAQQWFDAAKHLL
jgi:predicted AAA+ superfamily ATPase